MVSDDQRRRSVPTFSTPVANRNSIPVEHDDDDLPDPENREENTSIGISDGDGSSDHDMDADEPEPPVEADEGANRRPRIAARRTHIGNKICWKIFVLSFLWFKVPNAQDRTKVMRL